MHSVTQVSVITKEINGKLENCNSGYKPTKCRGSLDELQRVRCRLAHVTVNAAHGFVGDGERKLVHGFFAHDNPLLAGDTPVRAKTEGTPEVDTDFRPLEMLHLRFPA